MAGEVKRGTVLATALALAALLPTGLQAAQEVAQIPIIMAPPGTAGLGGGLRISSDPYFTNDRQDPPLDLVPMYLYEGKWLFAHGTAGGIHMYRNDWFSISALAQYRFQNLDPSRDSFYEGLEKRSQTLDAGLTAKFFGDNWLLDLQWVTDTLNNHNGQEAQISYRYAYRRGSWLFSPFISWRYQNANLANYYFGVSEAEARPDRPAYAVGGAQIVSFGLNTSYSVTERILLFGNIGFGGFDDAIENSPLVDNPSVSAAFVGGTYMFGNVFKPTTSDEDRVSEWSWRVNYGYQADGNIISEIDQGDFSKSSVADTNLAGFTLARLLTDGRRVDFLGKIALFRHLEEDYEGSFNSYAAYIMAMGKGYSPWTSNELFRWGFAFGMSYADQVPIAEQLKQEEKGGNTSRFLNYLELQVDFPLRRVSKAKWIEDCYAGVTVVHRSGIFGTSNILGDVAGGADWITAHFECVQR